MKSLLLACAILGWLFSVFGAVLADYSAFRQEPDPERPFFFVNTYRPRLGKVALTLIVGGATVGALGTIVAVWTG